MYWTLELATKLEDAPWPATKDELIDYAQRTGAPMEVIENLMEIEDGETHMTALRICGQTILQKKTFFSKRTNTNTTTLL